MNIITLTQDNELQEIIQSNKYVVLDIFSTECPPCENLAPIYEKLSNEFTSIKFLKIFRQEHRDLMAQYYVMSSPTLLFFKDGYLLDARLSGAISEQDLRKQLEELLAS